MSSHDKFKDVNLKTPGKIQKLLHLKKKKKNVVSKDS